jgi:predicted CoA-binding protein
MVGEESAMSALSTIHDFLAQRRIAIIGVSHDPKDLSRTLLNELRQRGYDVVAVNPELKDVDGKPCFVHVQDIQPKVDGAVLMTSPDVTMQVVQDCAQAGITRVWMYRAGTKGGAVSDEAIRFCESKGMSVVPGECPFMFLPDTGWFHRAHGFIRRITGYYPH